MMMILLGLSSVQAGELGPLGLFSSPRFTFDAEDFFDIEYARTAWNTYDQTRLNVEFKKVSEPWKEWEETGQKLRVQAKKRGMKKPEENLPYARAQALKLLDDNPHAEAIKKAHDLRLLWKVWTWSVQGRYNLTEVWAEGWTEATCEKVTVSYLTDRDCFAPDWRTKQMRHNGKVRLEARKRRALETAAYKKALEELKAQ